MTKSIKQTKILEPLSKDGIFLCQTGRYQKKNIFLSQEDRIHHQYFVGQNDMGKSKIILNQVAEDIEAGNGFCFIDQYGDYANEILKIFPKERIDDLVYIDFSNLGYPTGINILDEAKNTDEIDVIINHIIDMFLDMYGPELFGPRIQDYVRNACIVLMEGNINSGDSKYTFFDIIKLITKEPSAFILGNIKDPAAYYRWNHTFNSINDNEKREIIPFLQSKLSPLFTGSYVRNILLQPTSTVNFSEMVKGNKVIICNLARGVIGNLNAEILGRILMMEMNTVLLRRENLDNSGIKPYFLYLDGFHDYVGASFGNFLLNASRNKLGVIMFNDYVAQLQKLGRDGLLELSKFIFNVVGTVGAFRMGSLDAESLEKFFSPYFTKLDLQELKNNSLIIKKYGNDSFIKPFLGYIKMKIKGIKNFPEKIDIIKEISSLKWGKKRGIIDNENISRFWN